MKKFLSSVFFVFAMAFSSFAIAAPFLVASPYPSTGTQPDAASVTINGGSPVACTLQSVTGGLQPRCDLAALTNPGTYTLVMTVTKSASLTNGTNTATNSAAGSASSVPFTYIVRDSNVPTPALSVAP